MSASVEITEEPSTEGATQTRSLTVQFTTPDYDSSTVKVTILIDATQNGSFREVTSDVTGIYSGVESNTLSFSTFIGVNAPYDLRAKARFKGSGDDRGKETTVTTTTSIGGSVPNPTTPTFGADGEEIDPDQSLTEVRGGDAADVTPRIGPIEPIVMEADYQLPWDRDSNQTGCGKTIQKQNGDFDWRIVFNGVLALEQVDRLRQLRNNASSVATRSAVFGVKNVTFDQLSLTRSDSPKVIRYNGEIQPLYEFQLQTKELESDENNGRLGGN